MMADLLAALALPEGCRVDQRVPKKLLIENGAPTAVDKRLINDGVEEIQWLAALKPNTVGVPVHRDEVREYLEIAVLAVTSRLTEATQSRASRLAELLHRAVPYPVVLLLQTGPRLKLSLAHKRWSENEAGKTVLDGGEVSAILPDDAISAETLAAFTQALPLARQPQSTLFTLYQGWMNSIQALLAARLTGAYKSAGSSEQATARHRALQEYRRLEQEANRLRAHAAKENQLARQVELNLSLKQVQQRLAALRDQL